jgi:glutathione S-transferase
MLTIWGRLNSHNVKKVAWFAEELGLPHVRHDVGGSFGMDATYLALNPNALIPTIEDDGFVLWESNAILRYLAAKHGGDRWWPAHPARRALSDRWMDWQIDYAEAQRDGFVNLIRRSPAERDDTAILRAAERCAQRLSVLDRHLADHPWLSGETFGIGDIPMGTYIHTWFTLDMPRPDLPHVTDWYARLKSRPGYNRVTIPLT